MPRKSMRDEVLALFLDYPTKQWHFSELKRHVPIADNKLSRWLKIFIHEKLIIKTKKKGKMPYYSSNYESPEYQNTKKLFALNKLYESGFLNHISSLKKVNTGYGYARGTG